MHMLLTAVLALAALGQAAEEPEPMMRGEERPMILAYYYTWYTTAYGKHDEWSMWMRKSPTTLYPEGTDADVIVYPPAIRRIASCAYPLIGPYDSDTREVVRWHIRLAKAAGIDGFFVDVWGQLIDVCRRSLLDVILPVAEEEGFKIAVYDEAAQFHGDIDDNVAWAVDYLKRCKDSPAYLHIDGKPVYGVYQVWEGRMRPEQGRAYFSKVEEQVGDVYWIVDRVVARPGGDRPDGIDGFKIADGWADLDDIDAFSQYATFSTVREYRPHVLGGWFKRVVDEIHALGKRAVIPVHPGLDSRAIQLDEVEGPDGVHWTIPRAGGRTLRAYLHAAEASGADIITITSFNEWPETTNVEPSMTWPDPYLYLKILADYTGREWQAPPLPPEDVLDPAIRPHLRALIARQAADRADAAVSEAPCSQVAEGAAIE